MMKIERLVVENAAWIRRKAYSYCQNDFDAEDLASDTIERILKSCERFDGRRDFRPWASVIMLNIYITQYNRRKCVPFVGMDDDYSYASGYRADQDLAVSNILRTVRECARKSIAIECVMLYAKGYEYDEISRMLGIPKGTVMSRISNGRKMLRKALEL